jgi:hypothetical protein
MHDIQQSSSDFGLQPVFNTHHKKCASFLSQKFAHKSDAINEEYLTVLERCGPAPSPRRMQLDTEYIELIPNGILQ